jgi:hypothetical protein
MAFFLLLTAAWMMPAPVRAVRRRALVAAAAA